MASGLLALLDDVAAIAKLAAASLDDVALKAAKAGGKAAGIVIDDAAVTPRYVTGFEPARELPIIWRIALGSFRNKLLILLPLALLLSALAPFLITPLLMLGGAWLCLEGAEKVLEKAGLIAAHGKAAGEPVSEEARIAGAIRTDMILSAEIMAIALATLPEAPLWEQGVVLAVVGIGVTVAVYGAVALLVKLDDIGLALAQGGRPGLAGIGRGLVRGMPGLLAGLAALGTVAMLWVGGGILLHGLEELGWAAPYHALKAAGAALGGGFQGWLVEAGGAGIAGLALGALLVPAKALFSRG